MEYTATLDFEERVIRMLDRADKLRVAVMRADLAEIQRLGKPNSGVCQEMQKPAESVNHEVPVSFSGKKETQVRRSRSKCRRQLQLQIFAAQESGQEDLASELKLILQNLEGRWALGLNSRSARVLVAYKTNRHFCSVVRIVFRPDCTAVRPSFLFLFDQII